VLYNNAAVNSRTIAERLHTPPDSFLPVPVDGELGRVKLQEADMMFKINALGPLAVVQAFQGLLASSVVVNMSSDSGSITQKDAGGNYGYAASKAALNMITRTLAFDLRARDITVVALHPGWCRTSIGGPNAQLDPRVQSAVIVKLVDSLEMEHSGRFLSAVDGADVPW
jgi:NAD(P)-dependent dehydrogenase (short-subunit alcohol dehydrogenase family)